MGLVNMLWNVGEACGAVAVEMDVFLGFVGSLLEELRTLTDQTDAYLWVYVAAGSLSSAARLLEENGESLNLFGERLCELAQKMTRLAEHLEEQLWAQSTEAQASNFLNGKWQRSVFDIRNRLMKAQVIQFTAKELLELERRMLQTDQRKSEVIAAELMVIGHEFGRFSSLNEQLQFEVLEYVASLCDQAAVNLKFSPDCGKYQELASDVTDAFINLLHDTDIQLELKATTLIAFRPLGEIIMEKYPQIDTLQDACNALQKECAFHDISFAE